MYCTNCGAKIPEGADQCPRCGKPVMNLKKPSSEAGPKDPEITSENRQAGSAAASGETAKTGISGTTQSVSGNTQSVSGNTQAVSGNTHKMKNGLMRKLLPVFAVLAAVIVLLALRTTRKKTIDLDDYVTISSRGYNTAGTASAYFDVSQFAEDNEKWLAEHYNTIAKKVKNKLGDDELVNMAEGYADSGLSSSLKAELIAEELQNSCISGGLDKISNLSNGDEVTWHWNIDKETAASVFGLKFRCHDISIKVDNLEKLKEWDPFDNFSLSYSGYNTMGTAEIAEYGTNIDYRYTHLLDKTEGLSNGDEITVCLVPNGSDELDENAYEEIKTWELDSGYEVKSIDSLRKKFTVSGLPDLTDVDLFDGVSVTFSGEDNDGTAELTGDSDFADSYGLTYRMDKSDHLSNGDTVTVAVTYNGDSLNSDTQDIFSGISGETEKSGDKDPYLDAINAMLAERGMKTAYRIKKITVSGLTHLPASAADLSDRAAEDLKKQAEDFISARTAEIYDSYAHVSVSSTDCIGNFFLKGDGETGTDNILYLVYKVTQNFQPLDSQGSVTASGDITAYVLIEYDDLHLDADNHIASMRGPIYYQGDSFRQDFDRNDGNGRDARNITGFRDLQEIKDSVLVPAEEFYKVEDNTEE